MHSAGIAAVVLCMLTALIMVFMALGRTSLEKKIDEQGVDESTAGYVWIHANISLMGINFKSTGPFCSTYFSMHLT